MSDADAARRTNRRNLLLLAVVFIAPLLASYALFFFWTPTRHTNYGELVPPVPVAGASLRLAGGAAFRLGSMHGRWLMLDVDDAACEAACQHRLYLMRQLRLTQGKDMDRIERAWIVTSSGEPAPALVGSHPGLYRLRDPDGQVLGRLPPAPPGSHFIYLVDPLGNLMLRWPGDPDPQRMKKDIERLLRVSQVG